MLFRRFLLPLGVLFALACGPAAVPDAPTQPLPPPPLSAADGQPPADVDKLVGLWHSSFGAVKIEKQEDPSELAGIWVYDKDGKQVVGSFRGQLHGNILQVTWQEPSVPPLTGTATLSFQADGTRFSGPWQSDDGQRRGDWSGWREDPFIGRTPAKK